MNDLHFHYLTTTPEQFTRIYEDFIFKYYPAGSFDDRPLNLTTIDQIFQIRKVNLQKFYETFPKRKIVLVGDTSNGDIMKDYPELALQFPNQTACILIRNTSATDSQNHFPYNTKGFKDVPTSKYMFFHTTVRTVRLVGIVERLTSFSG
jgi:phosphatidate phosphatase APP1